MNEEQRKKATLSAVGTLALALFGIEVVKYRVTLVDEHCPTFALDLGRREGYVPSVTFGERGYAFLHFPQERR
jgi:hypothetical protein